jgi:hypothetical protein
MRRFAKIQWMMVAVIIAALLSWGGPAFVSVTKERWTMCQFYASYHSKQAAFCVARAKANAARRPALAARMEERAAFHAAKSAEYGRPWALFRLGRGL